MYILKQALIGKKQDYEKLLHEEARLIKKCQGIVGVIKLEGLRYVETDPKNIEM